LGKEIDAQKMANHLRNCGSSEKEITACAVRLYTADTFLYKLVNSKLRSRDLSKIDALGPFCWLLSSHLPYENPSEDCTVYRGATLTNEMIEEYKRAVNKRIYWSAFISTSKNRSVAEIFIGNTLFIIKTTKRYQLPFLDVSSLSQFPEEQEVLFNAGSHFKVERVQCKSRKYIIYMTSVT
jgi:hypothetical protein